MSGTNPSLIFVFSSSLLPETVLYFRTTIYICASLVGPQGNLQVPHQYFKSMLMINSAAEFCLKLSVFSWAGSLCHIHLNSEVNMDVQINPVSSTSSFYN